MTAARRTGHALVGTMIFLVLAMLLWTASYQQVACQLRVEKSLKVRTERADQLKKAAAWGLSLLETGKPSLGLDHDYACRMIIDGETLVARFLRTDTDRYEVHVRFRTSEDDDLLPLAPDKF